MTNFEKLRTLAEALHGPRWQNAVARDLGINSRQVHRWVSGQYSPNEGHISDLIKIAEERVKTIRQGIKASSI